MKKTILLFGLSMMLFSCAEDDAATVAAPNPEAVTGNKVLLLKVDALTNAFEGGKELEYPEADGFTIDYDYLSPSDFGGIRLSYSEVNLPIFDGTIHWMGLGQRNYPESLDGADAFVTVEEPAALPASTDFEFGEYVEEAEGFVGEEMADVQSLWNSIDNLAQVKAYRQSNPGAKIHLFLYTPSVGVGNPTEWDWYVIIKN